MKDVDRSELLRLLAWLCDEGLSELETARLEGLLANEDARRLYLEYMDLEAKLLTLKPASASNAAGAKMIETGMNWRPQPVLKKRGWWAQPSLRYVAVA